MTSENEEIDPLDAFMANVQAELTSFDKEKSKNVTKTKNVASSHGLNHNNHEFQTGEINHKPKEIEPYVEDEFDDEEYYGYEEKLESTKDDDLASLDLTNPDDIIALAQKRAKKKDLLSIDHSTIQYEPFRKNFYIEASELNRMSEEEVRAYRLELDGIKIRGISCPKPIKKWTQAGLSSRVLDIIRKLSYEKPTPIQAQAIPAVMSGRDVIGIAKTGSGKTLAYLLPLFRHISDQRPLSILEGPMALILTPTRELAVQVVTECKKFSKLLGFRAVCAYGGSAIKDQIADLKRGAEIVVCTPGRMIDLLCANSGKVTNLKRVTYVVIDEADRMFDLGFEPQVMKIMNNIRPDRQTVLFSATFPKQMEALARKILVKPLEIIVGGRSVVCSDVTQIIHIVNEHSKFTKLLEILGDFYNEKERRVLIFVERQDAADNLFKDLLKRGFLCISIHGGKDQADRDSSLADFKRGDVPILIATSVAARGIDVKDLSLVINYECPNHMEDYVHRVGRTGRAGNKGTAVTFISPDQERFAPDLVKALKASNAVVPEELQKLAENFMEKVNKGEARITGSGFGGKGLDHIDKEREKTLLAQKHSFGEVEEEEEPSVLEEDVKPTMPTIKAPISVPVQTTQGNVFTKKQALSKLPGETPAGAIKGSSVTDIISRINKRMAAMGESRPVTDRITEINARFQQKGITVPSGEIVPIMEENKVRGFKCEIDVNDYPQWTRWKVTSRDVFSLLQENTGVSITVRGSYFAPGMQIGPGQRRLYLLVEGEEELMVSRAKKELLEIIFESTQEAMSKESGKYAVL